MATQTVEVGQIVRCTLKGRTDGHDTDFSCYTGRVVEKYELARGVHVRVVWFRDAKMVFGKVSEMAHWEVEPA